MFRNHQGGEGMTKADIVEEVYSRVGFSKKESSEVVETVLETIKTTLEKGDMVKIAGFGNFVIRSKGPRKGRNPKTGQEIEITPRKVVTFKPSQVLKEHILNHPAPSETVESTE
jgi:integration host factor subunit alpha